ncbi:MAG: DUF6155 family protein [Saprospiraceae bacterium]
MRKTTFTKFINSLSEEELKSELDKIYTKYKSVKEFYTMELGESKDRMLLLDKAKKKIAKLYDRRRARSRVSKTNVIIKEMVTISIFDHELADVYLTHAEVAAIHVRDYRNPKDAEVNTLVKSFKTSINLALSSGSFEDFRPRFEKIFESLYGFYWIVEELEFIYDDMIES